MRCANDMIQNWMKKMRAQRPPLTARNSMMNMLARRDHSEKELRKKLSLRFNSEQIEAALDYAKVHGWLLEKETLSRKFADQLHRQKKGIKAINFKLKEKGLPEIKPEPQQELEKAIALAQNRISSKSQPLDRSAKEKIGRYLLSRGFEPSVVRKVIYEEL
jgi:regulatory protein